MALVCCSLTAWLALGPVGCLSPSPKWMEKQKPQYYDDDEIELFDSMEIILALSLCVTGFFQKSQPFLPAVSSI